LQPLLNAQSKSLFLNPSHPCIPQPHPRSSGCGDGACTLCAFNPSRICRRNLKQKYLIDDHLRAKCGAALRVEAVDDAGQCVGSATPAGLRLELCVLNGERYGELCPDDGLLDTAQLRSCILVPAQPKKPLLKREGGMGMADDGRIFVLPEVSVFRGAFAGGGVIPLCLLSKKLLRSGCRAVMRGDAVN